MNREQNLYPSNFRLAWPHVSPTYALMSCIKQYQVFKTYRLSNGYQFGSRADLKRLNTHSISASSLPHMGPLTRVTLTV